MTPRIRCAIYTRKSSEEGLDQSFNSLDAQREACEAFIRSQKHEGWIALSTKYDDGGFSGGNMERPAFQKLMADIADGKVNTVVVYKVDRLTRSLADFAKIIEQFDAMGVTFVSVTQQFNTTTSMGRLTLNVLLSFAQFEREVTGERIRDKIAASKAKGMWMGGGVPIGYDLRDRRLHINPQEAERVREIFRQFLRLRTVPALMSHLRESAIRIKSQDGGNPENLKGLDYARGALYHLLRNRIYVGEIEHKGSIYPGEHEGIVDRELWNQVQELLNLNRNGTRERSRAASGSMLTGLLFSESGARYIPTNTQKGGRRYLYYTSQAVIKGEQKDDPVGRLPAPVVEAAVAERILKFLESPTEILDVVKRLDAPDVNYDRILKFARQRAVAWLRMPRSEQADLIRSMLQRAIVHESSIELQLNVESTMGALQGRQFAMGIGSQHQQTFSLRASFRHVAQGKSVKLVIGHGPSQSSASREAIAKAVARARSWYEMIVQGKVSGLPDICRQHGLTHRYVKNIFPLAFLSPELVECLLNGPGGHSRTLESLVGKVPMRWDAQRACVRGRESH
jgi:DNA invertase Pin-like site-specific DNA recombinase